MALLFIAGKRRISMFCIFVSDDYDDVGGDEFEPLSPDQSPMEQMFGMSDQEIPVKDESLCLF